MICSARVLTLCSQSPCRPNLSLMCQLLCSIELPVVRTYHSMGSSSRGHTLRFGSVLALNVSFLSKASGAEVEVVYCIPYLAQTLGCTSSASRIKMGVCGLCFFIVGYARTRKLLESDNISFSHCARYVTARARAGSQGSRRRRNKMRLHTVSRRFPHPVGRGGSAAP